MNKVLFVVLILAFLVRFFDIQRSPAALFSDEVDMGNQARSFIQTGKDYLGHFSPFYFRSYNSDRTPLPIYLVSITTRIFKDPMLQVRMPFVLFGVLIVFLTYQILLLLTKSDKAAFWGAFISSINPWQIQFSRIAFESIISLGVLMLAIWFFLLWQLRKSYRHILLSSVFFGLSAYTYRTMSLFSPLIFLTLMVIYATEFFKLTRFRFILILAVFLALYFPFIYKTVLAPNDQTRISQISIFSDPQVKIWVQRNREIDSGDLKDSTLGKKAVWTSPFFHNKLLSWAESFRNNYFESFSTSFLFISGDPNLRQSPDGGLLLLPDIIGLIAGLIWIFTNAKKDKGYFFLILWLLVSPIPSNLTTDGGGGHHASRLLLLSAPLVCVVGIGWWKLVSSKKITVLMIATYLVFFTFYYHHYLVHYPIKSARSFGYGYRESFEKIGEIGLKKDFDRLWLSTSIDPPLPYMWFWSGYTIKGIEKVETFVWPIEIKDRELLLLTERDIKREDVEKGAKEGKIKLIETIRYPDNEPAFYILTKGNGTDRGNY